MIVNRASLDIVFTSFNGLFSQAFQDATAHHDKIAMEVRSGSSEEKYGWMGKLPSIREWVGDRIIHNLMVHDYTIKNRKFESTIQVSRTDIEDDRVGIFKPILSEMGLNAKQHPDLLLFELLLAGFDTGIGYDGQPFFDADHPVIDKSGSEVSVSNVQAGSEEPWFLLDTTRNIKPFVYQKRIPYSFQRLDRENDEHVFMNDDYLYGVRARVNVGYGLWQLAFGSKAVLNKENYAAARTAMMKFRGDNGAPLNVRPTMLVVGPNNEEAALNIVNAERDAAGATNVWKGTAELLVAAHID